MTLTMKQACNIDNNDGEGDNMNDNSNNSNNNICNGNDNNNPTSTSNRFCDNSSQLAVLFDDFMQFGSIGLHIVGNDGIIKWANQAELDLLGYTWEEYIGQPIADFHVSQSAIGEILGTLLSGCKVKGYIAPIRCKDGHTEYMEINSSMRQVNGKCVTTRCFSVCVTDRVMREKAQLEALARKKEAEYIREETKKKTDFLRSLCHELRNPLSGVAGNLELVIAELHAAAASSATDANDQQFVMDRVYGALEYAQSAQLAAEHQMLVINDTLSLSRLESSDFQFHPRPADFVNILAGVMAILGVKAKERGVHVHVADESLIHDQQARYVKTDIVWVKQLIINLLSNAIKFTETGGQVNMSVKAVDTKDQQDQDDKNDKADITTLEVTVQDTGIGMTKEEQTKLFGEFSQANEMISAQFGGSGLGLHIVKRMLDRVRGSIRVTSEKGVGSAFVATLPCGRLTDDELATLLPSTSTSPPSPHKNKPQSEPVPQPPNKPNETKTTSLAASPTSLSPKLQQPIETTKASTTAENDGGVAQQPAKPPPTSRSTSTSPKKGPCLLPLPSAQGIHVLVVDDIHMNRKMLSSYLHRRGYTYELAENGKIALELHAKSRFDIILTDIDMPVMDGMEMTLKLRQLEEAQQQEESGDFTASVSSSSCSGSDDDEDEEASSAGRAATTTTTKNIRKPPVPIIGISGNVFPEDIAMARGIGITEYICKPFKFPDLEAVMLKYLATASAGADANASSS